MIKYLGSKRRLLPSLVQAIESVPEVSSVIDLFSGTSRVGHALKARGLRVLANDHNAYAETLARCYVQADREDVARDAAALVTEMNALPGAPGYLTEMFCVRSRFFHPKNGERMDAIRRALARKALPPELEAVMLVSLMEAADRVDSTTGVQMAYLKKWATRAGRPLELRVPDVLPRARAGKGAAHGLDAREAARALEADVAYLDPPYNQHSYLGNYHVWETLVRGDEPEAYGTACKRVDCRERRSDFNSKRACAAALREVIASLRVRALVVSFSDEGFLTRDEIMAMLTERGEVSVQEHGFRRYVGAQIGIHDPSGRKVGTVSHVRNTEYVFTVLTPGAARTRSPAPATAALQLPRTERSAGVTNRRSISPPRSTQTSTSRST